MSQSTSFMTTKSGHSMPIDIATVPSPEDEKIAAEIAADSRKHLYVRRKKSQRPATCLKNTMCPFDAHETRHLNNKTVTTRGKVCTGCC